MQKFRRHPSIGQVIAVTTAALTLGIVATLGVTAIAQPRSAGASTESLVYTPLTLINGWTNGPFSTRSAAVARDGGGIVHFKGAIASGTVAQAFTLPAKFTPSGAVYVAVDMCNGTNGRLQINTDGTVLVEAEGNVFTNAQCFTSLDGVSFAK